MKAEASLADKILHHLSFFTHEIPYLGKIHVDALLVSCVIFTLVSIFFFRVSKNLQIKPRFAQNLCEFMVDMVRKEILGVCPHYVHIIGPLALSLFLAVFFMNLLDVFPASLGGTVMGALGSDQNFRLVPTADLNVTLALATFSFLAIQAKVIYIQGLSHYLGGWFSQPFGTKAFFVNIFSRLVEEFSRIFSLSMRLFGNMFGGEVIFALLAFSPVWLKWPGVFVWCLFHLLIIYLQAFIFTMLVIVMFSLSLDH